MLSAKVLVAACLFVTIGNAMEENVAVTDEVEIHRSYFIVYKNQMSNPQLVNCTAPSVNYTQDMISHIQWQPPEGVEIHEATDVEDPTVVLSKERDQTSKTVDVTSAWVQMTPDRLLRFHNPDDTLRGPYTCQGVKKNGQILYTNVVWVHVVKKYVFETGHRFQVGLISAGVFLAFVVLCYVANRAYKRSRLQYSMAPKNEDGGEMHLQIRTDDADSKLINAA